MNGKLVSHGGASAEQLHLLEKKAAYAAPVWEDDWLAWAPTGAEIWQVDAAGELRFEKLPQAARGRLCLNSPCHCRSVEV